jgi:enamine deaminase RidA (YjgF/YER057c/UK114 family)
MNKLTQSELRMQMLAGVITEGQYAAAINQEIENTEKDSLNEHMIGGIVGIGAINQIPPRAKTDYEDAFEHFLGKKYEINEEMESDNKVEAFLDDMINTSIPEDSEEGEEINGVWEAEEYADEDAYGEAAQEFKNAHEYIMGKGGETTIEGNPDVTYKALPNGDIAYSLIATLDEGKEVEEPYNY